MKTPTFLSLSLAAASLLFVIGCEQGPPKVDVPGVVTLDNQPAADVEVTFILDGGSGSVARAKSDASGAFVVQAVAGSYKVVLFKPQVGPNPMQSALPEKYMHPTTTPFHCVVPPPAGPLTLALSSKTAE